MATERASTQNIVGGPDSTFGLAILLGGVGAEKVKEDVVLPEEVKVEGVDKLAPVVYLKGADVEVKLVTGISNKG